MTGWAATNTLREYLALVENPTHAENMEMDAALALLEAALDAAERVTHSTQDTVHGAVSDLRAALRAVREGT